MNRNNRGNARLNSMIPIQIMFEDRSLGEALVDNISFGGVKLLLPIPVPIGSLVRLAIGHQNTVVSVIAECVWLKQANSVAYNYCGGFAFQNVSLETYQKIREILFKLSDNDKMDL